MELAALGALAKPALYLAILVGIVWLLSRIKRAGRVEAERDALDKGVKEVKEAGDVAADVRRRTDADLDDSLHKWRK